MRAWLRSRGRSALTRYHDALNRGSTTPIASRSRLARDSREPPPEREAQPVERVVGPDPDERAPVDLDLRDAFDRGPQPRRGAREARLDPEVVAPFLGVGDGGELL